MRRFEGTGWDGRTDGRVDKRMDIWLLYYKCMKGNDSQSYLAYGTTIWDLRAG